MLRWSLVLALAAAALPAAGKPKAAKPAPPASEAPATHRIVGGGCDLLPRRGGKPIGELALGAPVRLVRTEGELARIETRGSVRLTGLVRSLALGLRVVTAAELTPERAGRAVTLQPGADVRVLATRGPLLVVETVGVVVRGLLPRTAVAVAGPEFVYPEADGPIFELKRAVELADPGAPARPLARLHAAEEVIGLLEDGQRARVRTYGPIVLEGLVPRDALVGRTRREVTLPGGGAVAWEIAVDVDVLDAPRGQRVGRALGGTPVVVEEEGRELARIMTAGDVRTRGYVPMRALTRLAPVQELLK
jgi:hypothetical protein